MDKLQIGLYTGKMHHQHVAEMKLVVHLHVNENKNKKKKRKHTLNTNLNYNSEPYQLVLTKSAKYVNIYDSANALPVENLSFTASVMFSK